MDICIFPCFALKFARLLDFTLSHFKKKRLILCIRPKTKPICMFQTYYDCSSKELKFCFQYPWDRQIETKLLFCSWGNQNFKRSIQYFTIFGSINCKNFWLFHGKKITITQFCAQTDWDSIPIEINPKIYYRLIEALSLLPWQKATIYILETFSFK